MNTGGLRIFAGVGAALLVMSACIVTVETISPILVEGEVTCLRTCYTRFDFWLRERWHALGFWGTDCNLSENDRDILRELDMDFDLYETSPTFYAPDMPEVVYPFHKAVYVGILLGPVVVLALLTYHRIVFPFWVQGAHPRCPGCGYMLTGLTIPRCPECGWAIQCTSAGKGLEHDQ